MAKVITTELQHSGASDVNITLASDRSVTFPGNVTCSGTATGFGGGKILKVEGANLQVSFSTTTTNAWVATGIKDSITPSAASSKIIAFFGGHDQYKAGTGHSNYTIGFKVAGGSATYLGNATNGFGYLYTGQSGSTSISTVHAPSYSVGEAIEYELYGKAAGGGTLYMGNGDANVGIVLMEVAA